jgi:hypothetical protein
VLAYAALASLTMTVLVEFHGGSWPIVYTANWGHGAAERGSVPGATAISLSHTFPAQPDPRSYTLRVTATDAAEAAANCEVGLDVPGSTAPGG